MKIYIHTPYFHPRIGGLESVVETLAREFVAQGHAVRLLTDTPFDGVNPFPFPVVRQPRWMEMLDAMRWCDVFHQPNISLKALWPMAYCPRPWVVAHHIWYRRDNGSLGVQDVLKQVALLGAGGISISQAIADQVVAPSVVLGNPYRSDVFRLLPDVERRRDLVFLGRLIPEKGMSTLLEALTLLKQRGREPSLTVVGTGPQLDPLKADTQRRALARVEFAGAVQGEALARLLNAHRIMVVPSRWEEPFGIVALEGLACGCAVVASERGGLKDAVGECGVLFPNGDSAALANALEELLDHPARVTALMKGAAQHLQQFDAATVARRYLGVFADNIAAWHGRRP